MTAAAAPAHTRLPTILPPRAEWQSLWVEGLNNRQFGDVVLTARVIAPAADGPDDDTVPSGAWIAFDDGRGHRSYLRPLLATGAVPALTDAAGRPDAAAAAAAMGEVEPLVGAIERVAGTTLRPIEVTDHADAALVLEVDARARGAVVHRAWLALPAEMPAAGAPLPSDPETAFRTIPRLIAEVAGPAVTQASLSRIGVGDLLLLGTSGVVARLGVPGRHGAWTARIDTDGGVMVIEQALDDAVAATAADDAGAGDALSVPTVIEIDGTGLTADRLAALAPGSVVPVLAASGGVLPVRLRAAGRAIATGELVAVGEGYGVLITARLRGDVVEG